MNDDYKRTKEKIQLLIDEQERIEKELRTVVSEYMMRKLDIKKQDAISFGYKKLIREEFGLVI